MRAPICLKLTLFVGLLVVVAAGVPVVVFLLKAHKQLVQEIERRLLTVSTMRQEQLRQYFLGEIEKTQLIANRHIINRFLQQRFREHAANTNTSSSPASQLTLAPAVQSSTSESASTPTNEPESTEGSVEQLRSLADYDLCAATAIIYDFLHTLIYDSLDGSLLLASSCVSPIDDSYSSSINSSNAVNPPATNYDSYPRIMASDEIHRITASGLILSYPTLVPTTISNSAANNYVWAYNVSRPIYVNDFGGQVPDPAEEQRRRRQVIGVLTTMVNATRLAELYNGRTGLLETGELMIGVSEADPPALAGDTTTGTKVRLLFPPRRLQGGGTSIPERGAMARAIHGETGISIFRDYSGVKVIAAYRPVGFMHWGLVAKLDLREAYSSVKHVQMVIIITVVVLALVGILASLCVAKIFSSGIVELKRAAVELGGGDMSARVREGTACCRDEISDLRDTFNSMALQMACHQTILEHKVRERTSDLACANDGLAKEIEERRRIERELEQAKDVAVAANRIKSEFLANMSHEIRTPLNAIVNFTDLCLDTNITPEQHEHLNYVRFAAQHLLRLISDILDFSKIEAGKLEIEEVEFSLYDQLEQAVSVLAARAYESGLELCCRFDSDAPDRLVGDPGRLLQIFVNLIGNAIKFTKQGEVVASVSLKSKSVDVVELLFGVKDTGLGIPKTKQSLLFQAFSQVDSSTQRLYGGTGLGLVISYRLAVAMGGEMWMESEGIEGCGSTFWFTARFKLPHSSATMPFYPWNDMFKDVSALVVDDNESSRRILIDMLKNWGMKVDGAGTVEDAICALERASECRRKYDVLLLDMWLSGTDAFELVSYLRQRVSLSRKCLTIDPNQLHLKPSAHGVSHNVSGADISYYHVSTGDTSVHSVIMLTSVNHADASRCVEYGLSYYVSKPLKRAFLVRVLQSALGDHGKATTLVEEELPIVTETTDRPRSLHILVAEDNIVNQRVVLILLRKWGHTVVLVGNGEEAVEQATKQHFDLILMDVQMPLCDGFQATARIRELEKAGIMNHGHIPIVAMTAYAMFGDEERCIASGMDFHISKPLNAKSLQELLKQIARASVVNVKGLHE